MSDSKPRTAPVPVWVTVAVAFLAIASYLGMVVVLYLQRGQGEQSWGRALSLHTGVQAVAFAAFGWALGTQVGQGAINVTAQQAKEARQRMETAQQELTQAVADRTAREHDAEQERRRGTLLATHLRDQQATAAKGRAQSAQPPSAETIAVARTLYPEVFEPKPDAPRPRRAPTPTPPDSDAP